MTVLNRIGNIFLNAFSNSEVGELTGLPTVRVLTARPAAGPSVQRPGRGGRPVPRTAVRAGRGGETAAPSAEEARR